MNFCDGSNITHNLYVSLQIVSRKYCIVCLCIHRNRYVSVIHVLHMFQIHRPMAYTPQTPVTPAAVEETAGQENDIALAVLATFSSLYFCTIVATMALAVLVRFQFQKLFIRMKHFVKGNAKKSVVQEFIPPIIWLLD